MNIGCAGATVQYRKSQWDPVSSHNIYWVREQELKRYESNLGILHSITGTAFAMRRANFQPLDADTGDDLVIPLQQRILGRRTILVDSALAIDKWPAKNPLKEIKLRKRITLRALLSILRRKELLNPFKYGGFSIALLFHKFFRFTTPPVMVIALMLSLFQTDNRLGLVISLTILTAFLYGLLGAAAGKVNIKLPLSSTINAFIASNIGICAGNISLLRGNRIRGYTN